MPEVDTLVTFLGVTFLVLVVPGPSVVYVVARSVERGRRAGLWSMVGLEAGLSVHVVASTVGLSAAVAASGPAYELMRFAGAGYLGFLAISQFVGSRGDPTVPTHGGAPRARARLVRDGFLVDVLNPKTCIFFVAFLPQFVDPDVGPAATQLLFLGLLIIPVAALCDGTYALVAGSLRDRLLDSVAAWRRVQVATGAVYLLLAAGAVAL